jgi:acetoin utilization deacetylase AcuC-like enzyme
LTLKEEGQIHSAAVLDFDLHFGDGNVNILEHRDWVTICNPAGHNRKAYLKAVENFLTNHPSDIIGISAGFDNHLEDWGGLLQTDDYRTMGRMAARSAQNSGGGCFAILEGGYNHDVIGQNAAALIEGLEKC